MGKFDLILVIINIFIYISYRSCRSNGTSGNSGNSGNGGNGLTVPLISLMIGLTATFAQKFI